MAAEAFRRIEIDLTVHRAIERRRASVDESENDILRRLLAAGARRAAPPGSGTIGRAPGVPRKRGLWSIELGGRRLPAANLKDAYRRLLCELSAAHPHFLETFALEKERRRRFVARSAAALYGPSPHLARLGQRLVDGWFFDTNLSATQVAKRARIAARLCGLFYGQDVRILDNLREI